MIYPVLFHKMTLDANLYITILKNVAICFRYGDIASFFFFFLHSDMASTVTPIDLSSIIMIKLSLHLNIGLLTFYCIRDKMHF